MYGRAFVFGRSDWEYVFNTFAFGYAIGYHFIERATGPTHSFTHASGVVDIWLQAR